LIIKRFKLIILEAVVLSKVACRFQTFGKWTGYHDFFSSRQQDLFPKTKVKTGKRKVYKLREQEFQKVQFFQFANFVGLAS